MSAAASLLRCCSEPEAVFLFFCETVRELGVNIVQLEGSEPYHRSLGLLVLFAGLITLVATGHGWARLSGRLIKEIWPEVEDVRDMLGIRVAKLLAKKSKRDSGRRYLYSKLLQLSLPPMFSNAAPLSQAREVATDQSAVVSALDRIPTLLRHSLPTSAHITRSLTM